MVNIVTTKSITYGDAVLDPKTKKPIQHTVKFNKREVTVDMVEHVRVKAGEVLDVDATFAKQLIDGGHARLVDPALDPVSPTKPSGDPALS